jgi:hypothetical protein
MIRRGAIIGLLGVLAYTSGASLGRFVVAGLDLGPRGPSATSLEDALAELNRRGAARAGRAAAPAPEPIDYGTEAHVCEGCDAHLMRDRQFAEIMRLYDDVPSYEEITAQHAESHAEAVRPLAETDRASAAPPRTRVPPSTPRLPVLRPAAPAAPAGQGPARP